MLHNTMSWGGDALCQIDAILVSTGVVKEYRAHYLLTFLMFE